MSEIDKIKNEIVKKINLALKKDLVQISHLVYPPDKKQGDLSLPCFSPARILGENPSEISRLLVEKIKPGKIISGVNSAGPYFNININKEYLCEKVLEEIGDKGAEYGRNDIGKSQKILIEYSNGNTHKEYHVGHVRNACYGNAINRILDFCGYEAIPVSYVNDFGIHAAKTIWAYREFYQDCGLPENKGEFLGKVYARAVREAEKSKIAKQMIELVMKKIESREGREYDLWQETRTWSIEQIAKIHQELGIKFKKIYYESELIDRGREIVKNLLEKKILKKSQGAVIADLEEYGLGVLVILRSDGTATYPVADIPLAGQKFKDFKPDASLYIVDIRQAQYFKQLFKILKLMGHQETMIHLGYDFVKLPTGMMSSRSGNVKSYEELKTDIFVKAVKETKERHEDWSEEKISQTAEIIAGGAIKFEMLKVGAGQEITFDIKKALSFSGFTAAYLQYTVARINSIIKKAEFDSKADCGYLKEEKEYEMVLKIAVFGEAVRRAEKDFNPSEIARYLFELAQDFNDYYHKIPILKDTRETSQARIMLVREIGQVIKNGLYLLGIETLKEM